MQEKTEKKSLNLLTNEVDEIKKDNVERRDEIAVVRKLSSENDAKLETDIEAKLLEQVQLNITSKADDKLKCMKDDVSETLEIEILQSNFNLDSKRHIEEVCEIDRRASGKIRPACIKTNSEESKVETSSERSG